MIIKYPLGLVARTEYFRVLKSIWTKDVKDFLIKRMVDSPNNVKPVIVLDDETKKSKCYFINKDNTDFELMEGMDSEKHCRRVNGISDYIIKKVKLQKSDKEEDEKKRLCDLVVKKYVNHEILSKSDDKEVNLI
tara:strand:- start:216 stop:617 length:402 start_codon:yes stop_codon:yes gene_type:complete